MSQHEIRVASCTVADLFSEKITGTDISGILEIPEYQRPYVWGKKEIDKLLSDINGHFKQSDSPLYYLGSIILHQHEGKLSIIDGQQRLTTLAIIQQLKDTNKVPKLKYASPTTIEHIKKNYNDLKNKDLSSISFDNLNITLVVTDNEDDAYTFFETQNTGGVRLSGNDIIKAHHLREISTKDKRDENYAITWEKQKNIETVIEQLIKARRWNVLNWKKVPSDRDIKGTKNSIIKDFSEKTLEKSQKAAYIQIISINNYFKISPYKLAIRQPLANGENFIDYLEQFCELYQRLFKRNADTEIPDEYYKFNKHVIQVVDGTAFLKELYEISMLCYANKFGIENLLEASYWIFRYTYSLRVSRKVVREISIPSFLGNNHYVFDIILSSFNHEQLVSQLKRFSYDEFNNENVPESTVKTRFITRVKEYFKVDKDTFDEDLKSGIESKLKENKNGKQI
jgi:uncharacterized protein with ParB-like and HNH nuclease domain